MENVNVKCITNDKFTEGIKTLFRLSSYSPELYSGHFFRRGGATLLFQLNCYLLVIQALGDWANDTYLR